MRACLRVEDTNVYPEAVVEIMSSSDENTVDKEFRGIPCPVCSKLKVIRHGVRRKRADSVQGEGEQTEVEQVEDAESEHAESDYSESEYPESAHVGNDYSESEHSDNELAESEFSSSMNVWLGVVRKEPNMRQDGEDYYIDPDPKARTTVDGWAAVCDLCAIVRDLDKHWSGNGYNGPVLSRRAHYRNRREDEYGSTCSQIRAPPAYPKSEYTILGNPFTENGILSPYILILST